MQSAFDLLRNNTLKDDHQFQANCLKTLPFSYKKKAAVLALALYQQERRAGNSFLLELSEAAAVGSDVLMLSDSQIKNAADKYADEYIKAIAEFSDDLDFSLLIGFELIKRKGVILSKKVLKTTAKDALVARFRCSIWWRRQLRKLHGRKCEKIGIDLGLVHKKAGAYCSDDALESRRSQRARNERLLSNLEAENEQGDVYTLAELSALGISNPEIKRHELMVRMRGFEDIAKEHKHVAEFYTITCPSRFHARSTSGKLNPKYEGDTPDKAQKYLCKIWARIRAKLARDEVGIYGFRVAEAHHDGTPHWHLLLFMHAQQSEHITKVIKHYAMQDTPNENGAKKYRFEAVSIDPKKGSATGYIAKYIAKNIDGFAVGEDFETGKSAADSSERVEAWAARWGIRQFQQIGGAPVGVWRELRRMDTEEEGAIEEARKAADSADWKAYNEAQGGVFTPRDSMNVKIAKWQEFEPETGVIIDAVLNRYGEAVDGKVFGLVSRGVSYLTRFYRWVIKQKNEVQASINRGGGFDLPLEFCK